MRLCINPLKLLGIGRYLRTVFKYEVRKEGLNSVQWPAWHQGQQGAGEGCRNIFHLSAKRKASNSEHAPLDLHPGNQAETAPTSSMLPTVWLR